MSDQNLTTMLLVATPKTDGTPNMAARRTVVDSAEQALEVAEETGGTVYELEPVIVDPPFPPVTARYVGESPLGEWLAGVKNTHGADA